MKVETVDVDAISPDSANVRRHGERNLETVRASLRKFGQQKPIVVDESGVIVAGNATWHAAKSLEWDTIDIVRTPLKGAEAVAYAIADNRTAELAEWDDSLAEALAGLQKDDSIDHLVAGFTDAEVEELVAGLPGFSGGESGEQVKGGDGGIYSPEQIADAAFAWYRQTGFPYPQCAPHECLQDVNRLSALRGDALLSTTLGYSLADSFHPHRFAAHAAGMRSPLESFGDDKALRKAIAQDLQWRRRVGRLPSHLLVLNGAQACSNFRPGVACAVYREFCERGAVVLDCSTGYGGRLVGFIASGVAGRYIGFDPCLDTHNGNRALAECLLVSDRVALHNLPIEDAEPCEPVDFSFTSPPYYRKEVYSDEPTQSCNRYATPAKWRDGFLMPFVAFQAAALKPGAWAVINIANVRFGKEQVPLVEMTKEAATDAGLAFKGVRELRLQNRMGLRDDVVAVEPMLLFQKPKDGVRDG